MLELLAIESDHGNSFRGKGFEQVLKRVPALARVEGLALLANQLLR